MDEATRLKLAAEVAGVREVFFPYPKVGEIQKDIHHLHFRDNGVSEGGVLTLFGESRCGKSKLLGDYAAQYPHQRRAIVKENGEFADRKEVLLMTVPDASTKNLLERMLALLTNQTTEQVKGSGARRFDIEEAIVHFATEVHLKLMILDEAQQGISNRKVEVTRDTASVIKNLSNAALSGDRVNPSGGDIRNPATLRSRSRQYDGSIGRFSARQGRAETGDEDAGRGGGDAAASRSWLGCTPDRG